MTHAELPQVIRTRMFEVVRALQRTTHGPDRDALDAYRQQLAAAGRAIEQPATPHARQPTPTLTRSPLPPEPIIEL
jgi:hypothetical protein